MMELLEKQLCSAFCGGLEVHAVPSGFAVSSIFRDNSGDAISFYISETPDGFRIEDDGDYLSDLAARDIAIDTGARSDMLNAILAEGGAYWDQETFEIRSGVFPKAEIGQRAIGFLSSLIRVRDLELVTRERVRSAFREDFLSAVAGKFSDRVDIIESAAPANDLSEFPADVVLTPKDGGRTAAIYLVNTNDKLNEALLAWRELQDRGTDDVALLAVLEEPDLRQISRRKFQRAQNRSLPMPIFRGDETATMDFIRREMKLA
jgi:hypothetical protein